MRLIKPISYLPEEIIFARIADALNHPIRKRVIELLQKKPFQTQRELLHYFDISTPSFHRHIKVLKQSGLLCGEYHVHFEALWVNEQTLIQFINETKKLLRSES